MCHQVELFITHISTAGLLGLFVFMVLIEEVQVSNALAHLRSMEFIVLIGVMQIFKVMGIPDIALR